MLIMEPKETVMRQIGAKTKQASYVTATDSDPAVHFSVDVTINTCYRDPAVHFPLDENVLRGWIPQVPKEAYLHVVGGRLEPELEPCGQ